jgi:hypothetical protein
MPFVRFHGRRWILKGSRNLVSQVYDLPDNPTLDYQQIQGVTVDTDQQTNRRPAISAGADGRRDPTPEG